MKLTKKDILNIINENLNEMPMDFDTQDRPHQDIQGKLSTGDTPLQKVPLPKTGEEPNKNFQELLASERYRQVIEKVRQYTGVNTTMKGEDGVMPLAHMMMDAHNKIVQIENEHRPELEQLAVELVTKEMGIPEGSFQFDVKIVGMGEIDTEDFNREEGNQENPTEVDIEVEEELMDDIAGLDLERAKIIKQNLTLSNALIIGGLAVVLIVLFIAKLNDADLQAQLEKIKVQLELAMINEQRNLQLLKVKGINQSDYDISLQQVKSSKADLAYTQSLIDKTVIKAPFTGQMGLRQVSLGAFINTATTIATLQKTDKLKIDFTLPEMYESYVKVGKSIKVEGIELSANTKMNASIFAIEPQINATTRNIKVRAQLQGNLLPGAYVKVYLPETNKKPSIMVPTNVIIPESKSKQIAVVKKGMAQLVDVETGYRTAGAVEITKGLNVGDSVIVAGMLFVRQGSKIKVGKTLPMQDITK